ncbi:MAG: hypothetical protein HOP29_12390 [Phycisphaerales bacterium]|nr:hypothetical protein [Phycisphaerales bacterium]
MGTVLRCLISTSFFAVPVSTAAAEVDLVWRPSVQTVQPGEIVALELVAVGPSDRSASIAAIDVVLAWDEHRLEYIGLDNNGPYAWLIAGLLPDRDGLNTNLADGVAFYTALARFDADAIVDGAGVLVATFRFRALVRTVATRVAVEPAGGPNSRTVVFGRESPIQDISGQFGNAVIRIGTPGDCTNDHAVGSADFGGLQSCFTGPVGPVDPPAYPIALPSCCPAFDFDIDGDIDLFDLSAFVNSTDQPNGATVETRHVAQHAFPE